jgi:ABC-type transport system involved in cytochrome c biogenesis permease subunit
MKTQRTMWMILCVMVTVGVWFPASAWADIVSGRVFGPDEKPLVGVTLTAKNAKGEATMFKSDKDGKFSTFLDPGKYTVTYAADATVEGVVEGRPQPLMQDIHLKKKGQ